jgi:hypothetical protein
MALQDGNRRSSGQKRPGVDFQLWPRWGLVVAMAEADFATKNCLSIDIPQSGIDLG